MPSTLTIDNGLRNIGMREHVLHVLHVVLSGGKVDR